MVTRWKEVLGVIPAPDFSDIDDILNEYEKYIESYECDGVKEVPVILLRVKDCVEYLHQEREAAFGLKE